MLPGKSSAIGNKSWEVFNYLSFGLFFSSDMVPFTPQSCLYPHFIPLFSIQLVPDS